MIEKQTIYLPVKVEGEKTPEFYTDRLFLLKGNVRDVGNYFGDGVFYSPCKKAFLLNKASSDSTWSSSGMQQSTGQTAAHCGSSWKPLHSVHFPGTM